MEHPQQEPGWGLLDSLGPRGVAWAGVRAWGSGGWGLRLGSLGHLEESMV